MANYLLGEEALYAYLIGRHEQSAKAGDAKFQAWAAGLTPQDYLYASRMSVAMIYASIERIANAAKRESKRQAVTEKLTQFKDQLLEVDEPVLRRWSTVRASVPDADGASEDWISSEQIVELATAVNYGYICVTRVTESLKALAADVQELQITDPWA